MKRKCFRQMFSGFLAGALAISLFQVSSVPVSASDTLPYLGESARGGTSPMGMDTARRIF